MDRKSATQDLRARQTLSRWQRLKERTKQLLREPTLLESVQPEPTHPEQVGLDQPADQFTPEELVGMFNRPPLVVQWD